LSDAGRVYRSIAAGKRPTDTWADKNLAEKEAQELYNVSLAISFSVGEKFDCQFLFLRL
jgi:hypothetical protein